MMHEDGPAAKVREKYYFKTIQNDVNTEIVSEH